MSNSMLKFGTPLFFLLKNFLTPHNYINNPHGFISVAFQGRRKLFLIGGGGLKARAEGPRKFLNLESLKCHFLDFGEDLTEF